MKRRKRVGSAFAPIQLGHAAEAVAVTDPAVVPDYSDADPRSEMEAVRQQWRANLRKQMNRYDTEHWICISFIDRDEKEAFLRALGLLDLGDKYLDGAAVARRLQVALR